MTLLPESSEWFEVSYQMLSKLFPNLALRAFKNYRLLDPTLYPELHI